MEKKLRKAIVPPYSPEKKKVVWRDNIESNKIFFKDEPPLLFNKNYSKQTVYPEYSNPQKNVSESDFSRQTVYPMSSMPSVPSSITNSSQNEQNVGSQ